MNHSSDESREDSAALRTYSGLLKQDTGVEINTGSPVLKKKTITGYENFTRLV